MVDRPVIGEHDECQRLPEMEGCCGGTICVEDRIRTPRFRRVPCLEATHQRMQAGSVGVRGSEEGVETLTRVRSQDLLSPLSVSVSRAHALPKPEFRLVVSSKRWVEDGWETTVTLKTLETLYRQAEDSDCLWADGHLQSLARPKMELRSKDFFAPRNMNARAAIPISTPVFRVMGTQRRGKLFRNR